MKLYLRLCCSLCSLIFLQGKPTSKGFTTTVTVESSLINPGEHQVRHTATDLATGETTMLHEERVQAANVHSKLQA